jgi:Terminase large subunit, T4likevirus-type, N-terminal
MNILRALDDPHVFANSFRGDTWRAWRVFLAALFALPMSSEELELYRKHTGRSAPSTARLNEAWLVCGRRSGKSFILATIAVFLAAFTDWRPFLGPGEIATIMIIARDRRQARVIKRFIVGLLKEVPMLRRVLVDETAEIVTLKNRVSIEIHTASFRSTRGYSICAALLDELAFWPADDAAEPDVEVINAIRPGMATIPGAMLLCASSPYARRGALWEAHRKHFGKDGDPILVWQAPTRAMNAMVPQAVIDEAIEADPASAAAEYGAEFRSDLEAFVSREVVEAAVVAGRYELTRVEGVRYFGFTDPSGGSSDSMTLAVCHMAGDRVILDLIRERRAPFSPDDVVREFAGTLKGYGLSTVRGRPLCCGVAARAFPRS